MGSNQVINHPLLFFHGFLGQATDWNFIKGHSAFAQAHLIEYMKEPSLQPDVFLSDWGTSFFDWKERQFGKSPVRAVGYSQGGRLLLQAFQMNPKAFDKLVLISSHPGLQSVPEKESRLQMDRKWAQRFRKDPWESLLLDWEGQSVFGGRSAPTRKEMDFDRSRLALCFENWSLAHQPDFRQLIQENQDRISVIVGEEDQKYVQLYKTLKLNSSAFKMEKGAAHRVPFDQPIHLVETLKSILS